MPSAFRQRVGSECEGGPLAALVALVVLLGPACASYEKLATSVADVTRAVAETVRPDTVTAHALCLDLARYTYLERQLGLLAPGGAASFPTWYETDAAIRDGDGAPKRWTTYCEELDSTGVVYDHGVLALRGYALALHSLAGQGDFDASGLAKTAEGAGTLAERVSGSSDIGSTAKSVGSAASTLAKLTVQMARIRKLESLVAEAAAHVAKVVETLTAYLDALEGERLLVLHHRDTVLKLLDARAEGSRRASSAEAVALAFELVSDHGARLRRVERRLALHKSLLAKLAATHARFAADARSSQGERAVRDAVQKLVAAIDDVTNARPEEP